MSRFNGSILEPGKVNVEMTHQPGPLAQPATITMQGAGGVKLLLLGGLTKVEALAGEIAAGMCSSIHASIMASIAARNCKTDQEFAEHADLVTRSHFERHVQRSVDLAEAIIAECQRRAAGQPQTPIGKEPTS